MDGGEERRGEETEEQRKDRVRQGDSVRQKGDRKEGKKYKREKQQWFAGLMSE